MQLLKITNIPMKIKMQLEDARLEYSSKPTRVNVDTTPGKLHMNSEHIKVRLDSTQLRQQLGYKSAFAATAEAAANGEQHIKMVADRYSAQAMAMTQNGADLKDVMAPRIFPEMPNMVTTFIPNGGTDITWQPPQLDVEYMPANVNLSWDIAKNTMEYVPGKFSMEILQYPKVQIEYIGGRQYVPPSSDPEYVEPEE